MPWRRLIIAAIATELVPILAVVAAVAVFSTGTLAGDQELAPRLGRWVGPIVGALTVFGGSLWVNRGLTTNRIAHGVTLGVMASAIDSSVIVAIGAPFEWVFVASQAGRLLAGFLGGLVSSRRAAPA